MPVFEFTLTKISKLGEFDPMYFQRYWGYAEGDDTPISFNSSNQDIVEGMDITAEEKTMKKSKNGTTYWQLRKVKVVSESASNPEQPTKPVLSSQTRSDGEMMEALRRIEEKIDKLVGEDEPTPEIPEIPVNAHGPYYQKSTSDEDFDDHYDTEREPMPENFLED